MADNSSSNVNDPECEFRNVLGMPSKRRMIWVAILIMFVMIVVVIAFTVINLCCSKSNELIPYAAFQSSINESKDPCEDFYDFSCDLWPLQNPILEGKSRITSFGILQDIVTAKERTIFENTQVSTNLPTIVNNAIQFFNLCTEQNGTNSDDSKVLIDLINHVGGWPILNNYSWNEDLFDWFHASAHFIKYLDVHTVIGVYSMDSDSYVGENVIYLKQPNLGIYDTLDHSFPLLNSILYVLNNSYLENYVFEDIFDLKRVEALWIEQFYSSDMLSNPSLTTIKELMEEIPQINWLNYLQLIMNDTLLSINKTITLEDKVKVDNFDYLKKIANVMSSNTFSKVELANLFGWFVVKELFLLIPGAFQQYGYFFEYEPDEIKNVTRDKCFDLITTFFSCSLDYLYIKNSSNPGMVENKLITSYVKSAFYDILQESGGLEETSKHILLDKLNAMLEVVSFPNYMFNKTEIDRMYKDFPLVSRNILKYNFDVRQYYLNLRYLHVKLPIDIYNMVLPRAITHVSAYYMVNRNAFVLPISLASPPFFYLHGPSYLNFGAIGSIIGHEIMHGFDQSEPSTTNSSNGSSIIFKNHSECFKNQYNIYDSNGKLQNNGTFTMRENIADSEGLHIAFNAHKKYAKHFSHKNKYLPVMNYTPDQMFFISFATIYCSTLSPKYSAKLDPHSVPKFRVNGAVSNSEHFAAAFNCPKGSAMNPVKKCSIW